MLDAAANTRPVWWPAHQARLAAIGFTRRSQPWLPDFLDTNRLWPLTTPRNRLDGIIGWGLRPSATVARQIARFHRLPYWAVEDGFIRSFGLGKAGSAPVSIVVDDTAPHFDARHASRLERLLIDGDLMPVRDRAEALRRQIVECRITKYNHLPDPGPVASKGSTHHVTMGRRRRILLVDQVWGDRSISGAGAGGRAFQTMVAAAAAEPNVDLLVRPHPDVGAGYAFGYLEPLMRDLRCPVQRLSADVSPHVALDLADEVWTVSSQLGFDAVLRGIPVTCFGAPFFAGWGITRDLPVTTTAREALARRAPHPRDIDDLVAASLILYARYRDLETGRPAAVERVIDQLAAMRRRAEAA